MISITSSPGMEFESRIYKKKTEIYSGVSTQYKIVLSSENSINLNNAQISQIILNSD